VLTTEMLGRAMLEVAKHGAEQRVLEADALIAIAEKQRSGGGKAPAKA
jgi:hypothetical protein